MPQQKPPIVLDVSGYSGPYTGDDIIQRLAKKGVFAIKVYKRGYGGSQGVQSNSGREIYDLYDAAQYVKSHYASYVDPNNVNAIGYSGGGGNLYGLVTKDPDYLRSANIFFGMSDYGHDPTYGWYEDSSDASTYDPLMVDNSGGTPFSRSRTIIIHGRIILAAGNNPYTHIQLFYNRAKRCPSCQRDAIYK